eukprot:6175042-Amphidinium_carterae.1
MESGLDNAQVIMGICVGKDKKDTLALSHDELHERHTIDGTTSRGPQNPPCEEIHRPIARHKHVALRPCQTDILL